MGRLADIATYRLKRVVGNKSDSYGRRARSEDFSIDRHWHAITAQSRTASTMNAPILVDSMFFKALCCSASPVSPTAACHRRPDPRVARKDRLSSLRLPWHGQP